MPDKPDIEEELIEEPVPELPNLRGVTVRCGRCLERRFFCLSTPSKLNVLTLICSGCGDVLSTGVIVEKVAEKKSRQKREEESFNKEDISYTG